MVSSYHFPSHNIHHIPVILWISTGKLMLHLFYFARTFVYLSVCATALHLILWSTHAGELQEWWNPHVPEVHPSWKWLWAKVPTPGEGRREREGRPSHVCVPKGKAPVPKRRAIRPDDWPQVDHLEPGLQERCGLELREVPHRAGRSSL